MTTLNGKRALITGSTSGIGWGVALELAKSGVNIALSGFGEADDIERKRQEIESLGVQAVYISADLAIPAEAKSLVSQAQKALGGIDILINNAGMQHVDKIEDFPDERWDTLLAVNLSACFHTIKTAMPAMKSQGFGRIINVASAHGLVASPNKVAYVASKHGMTGLSKAIAQEVVDYNITCNTLCPGWVNTPMVAGQLVKRAEASGRTIEEEGDLLLAEKQPKIKFTTAEDIGRYIVFLCHEDNSTLTGASISIDGGWVSQ